VQTYTSHSPSFHFIFWTRDVTQKETYLSDCHIGRRRHRNESDRGERKGERERERRRTSNFDFSERNFACPKRCISRIAHVVFSPCPVVTVLCCCAARRETTPAEEEERAETGEGERGETGREERLRCGPRVAYRSV